MTEGKEEQENPKVRPLDAFPLQVEGKEMIGIKDPVGIAPEIVFVPPEAFFLISLMDGTNGLRDMQAAYMRKYGTLLFSDKIRGLIEQLDSYLLLENDHFKDHLQGLRDTFKQGEVRKAVFAGSGYEADPVMLKAQLAGYFTQQGGPGIPQGVDTPTELKGFVAPHIDFTRGGTCYAHAYKALGESHKADLFCILGTCHTPMQNPFAFTLKAFETPLGTAEVATDIVEECAQGLPFDPFDDEFSHRNEHAIEFQVVFLQYLLGGRAFTIDPSGGHDTDRPVAAGIGGNPGIRHSAEAVVHGGRGHGEHRVDRALGLGGGAGEVHPDSVPPHLQPHPDREGAGPRPVVVHGARELGRPLGEVPDPRPASGALGAEVPQRSSGVRTFWRRSHRRSSSSSPLFHSRTGGIRNPSP